MNPTYKEYVFDFADLKLLSIVCNKCKTEIIFDVTETDTKMLKYCPSCDENFGGLFLEALTKFHRAYMYLTEKDVKATARIRIRREVNVAEF
jgi:hypothetical protein